MLKPSGIQSAEINDYVSSYGISQIAEYIDKQYAFDLQRDSQVEWRWMHQDRKLTTRIKKYMFDEYGIRLTPKDLETIGNFASQNYLPKTKLWYDITDKLGWQAGDFGDYGSCYWTSRVGAKEMLYEHGALAMRLWKPIYGQEDQFEGYARAWLYPITDDTHVIFNAYGEHLNTFGILTATVSGHDYKSIGLCNNKYFRGTLWINNGKGILVGPPSALDKYWDYDFGWPEINYPSCYKCDRSLNEGIFTLSNQTYCARCYDSLVRMCDVCGGEMSVYMSRYIIRGNRELLICYDCYDPNEGGNP